MTRPRPPRRLRIVYEADKTQPWIVQYDNDDRTRCTWVDIARFASPLRAEAYVKEVQQRDRVLLEAER